MGRTRLPLKDRYNRFTVIGIAFRKGNAQRVNVICDCGNKRLIQVSSLKRGDTRSCGCYVKDSRHTIHGKANHALYPIWKGMIARCTNKKHPAYKHYGAKGVTVWNEWLDIHVFIDWALTNGWKKGLQIDRYPNNKGNYEPGNVRFATPALNQQNRTNNKLNMDKAMEMRRLAGSGLSLTELSELYFVSISTAHNVVTNKTWVLNLNS